MSEVSYIKLDENTLLEVTHDGTYTGKIYTLALDCDLQYYDLVAAIGVFTDEYEDYVGEEPGLPASTTPILLKFQTGNRVIVTTDSLDIGYSGLVKRIGFERTYEVKIDRDANNHEIAPELMWYREKDLELHTL